MTRRITLTLTAAQAKALEWLIRSSMCAGRLPLDGTSRRSVVAAHVRLANVLRPLVKA